MSVRNGAERVFDFVDVEDGEADFLACLAVQVRVADSYVLLSRVVVDRNLNDVFRIALSGGHFKNAEAESQCGMRTGRAVHSAHCERVPYEENSSHHVAQAFFNNFIRSKVISVGEGFELLLDSQ